MSKKFLVPIDLNQLELQNATMQNLATAPASPVRGQIYFNTTTNKAMVYNGTAWVPWEANTTVDPATANPIMDGTAAVGTSVKYAREDHVHPSDTSRVPTTRTVNGHALSANVTVTASDIGVESGAEVNQNAFSNVKVGSTTIAADSKTDTLEIASGTNITVTPDATNDKVTIATSAEVNQNAFSNVKVTQGTTDTTIAADSKTDILNIVAGSNVTLTADASTDTLTIAATDTTYSEATTSAAGLMSSSDKTKLDGVATGAEVNVQANWTETSSSSDAYIKNKPTLGEAAAKDVDTSVTSGSTSTKVPTTAAVVSYIDSVVGAADAMRFKGTIGTGGTVTELPSAHQQGDTYRVITAGTYAGQTCEIGDLIIAMGTSGTTANDWTVAQTNIDGAITEINATAPITKSGTGSSRTIGISAASGSAAGSMSSAHYTKLEGIAAGAEVNQNAFSNVKVGSTTVAADSKTDTLELIAGSNVTLTLDATNDTVTIAASHPTYTSVTGKPTTNQTPAFNGTFTISQISQDTTGQISATDRTVKIPALPTASTSQGGIVKLNDTVDSTSTSLAATANSVKTAYDKGVEALAAAEDNSISTLILTIAAGETSVSAPAITRSRLVDYKALIGTDEVIVDAVIPVSGNCTFSIASAIASDITIAVKFIN